MSISVLKFGGTSVKSVARIGHVAGIIEADPADKKVVVLSAMGDTTDYLLRLAKQCSAVPDKRELDLLLASGEQVSISLLAIKLRERGINARAYTGQQLRICTDSSHTEARILDLDKEALLAKLNDCDVLIAAGFQGIDEKGEITTLGRGGSDTSAVAIAACVGALVCEIFTDVDGIYTADPNKVKSASLKEVTSYEEATQLAYAGAQVIHPRAVELAEQYEIQINVRNTFKPECPGTKIVKEEKMERVSNSYSVAISQKEACLKIKGADKSFDLIGRLSTLADNHDLTIYSVSEYLDDGDGSNCNSLGLEAYIGYKDIDRLKNAVAELKEESGAASSTIDVDLAKLSIIGRALSRETLNKLVRTLKEAGVSPRKIEFSDTKISCLIDSLKGAFASNLVHDSLNAGLIKGKASAA
ncbi:MAG TPA: aspartate kinase [Candidatus Melainabacteria bacterium]|nr:aspartate kinase [Candidatus Melainabacteria bacterium]